MRFNPEDNLDFGPHCRNCHRGSSSCGTCHTGNDIKHLAASGTGTGEAESGTDAEDADNSLKTTAFDSDYTTIGKVNEAGAYFYYGFYKNSRTVDWTDWVADDGQNWRQTTDAILPSEIDAICGDDGFSWPHRTLGWKMLKDDLFGLDFTGEVVDVGETRHASVGGAAAHDLDSVCLDCHNPTIWNASKNTNGGVNTHDDTAGTTEDDYDDELILRGLP